MARLGFSKVRTFSDILNDNKGTGPGFDLLRLALALSILASHCSGLTGNRGFLSQFLSDILGAFLPSGGPPVASDPSMMASPQVAATVRGVSGPARPYTLSRVPMFFALSGFLVMGSAFRSRRVLPFLGLRTLRILPALLVEVTLSAIVLGAIFTSLPLWDYFTAKEFYTYFLNIVGIVHYTLPGVFENNVSRTVNGNLWTLPAEFYSYLVAAGLMALGLIFNRVVFTCIFVVCTIPLLVANVLTGFGETPLGLDGTVSVYYFFVGVVFYLWRDKVPYNGWLFLVSIVLAYALMMSNRTVFIYPAVLTYITLFIGLSALPQIALLKTGDYSYGIYLYGYPISQALVAALPMVKGNLFGLLALTIIFTGLFSVFSWHTVEKRFLRLKRFLSPQSAAITATLHPTVAVGPEIGGLRVER